MTLRVANKIVELQGINKKIIFIVRCPYCERKKAKLNIKTGKWKCHCGKGGTEVELLRLAEENYLDGHPESSWNVINNKGVCK